MARLSIRSPGLPERIENLRAAGVYLGRGSNCEIKIGDPHLSRMHCRLEKSGGGYAVVDEDSRNGVKVNGEPVQGSRLLVTGDLIALGRTQILYVADDPEDALDDAVDAGQTVMLQEVSLELAEEEAREAKRDLQYVLQYVKQGQKKFLPLKRKQLTIGRHKSCGLVFKDKSVSSCHAAIEYKDGEYAIHDLGATNGVKVNGRKVTTATLKPGTRIRIGAITLGFKEVVRRASTMELPPEPADAPADAMPAFSDGNDTPPAFPASEPPRPRETAPDGSAPKAAASAEPPLPAAPSPTPPAAKRPAQANVPPATAPAVQPNDEQAQADATPAPAAKSPWRLRLLLLLILLAGLALIFFLPKPQRSEKTPPAEARQEKTDGTAKPEEPQPGAAADKPQN